ncbi:hypothetical protein Lal_00025209 [Lupinus albus]|nr:hypothetical protein Lal_00025209 [Lupinus albus]
MPRRRSIFIRITRQPPQSTPIQPHHIQVPIRLKLVGQRHRLRRHTTQVRREQQPLSVATKTNMVQPLPLCLHSLRHLNPPQPIPIRPHHVNTKPFTIFWIIPI